MPKTTLLIIIAINTFICAYTQTNCHQMVMDANAAVKAGNFRSAIQKYNAAKRCDSRLTEEVDARILKVFDEIERLKTQAEDEKKLSATNLKEMSDLVVRITDLLQDENSIGIIGFAPLKKQLLETLLPAHQFILKNSSVAGNLSESAKAHLQLSFSYEDVGNPILFEKEVETAYHESFNDIKNKIAKNDSISESILSTYLISALHYSWNLISKKELNQANNVLTDAQAIIQKNSNKSAKIYNGLAGIENAQSRLMVELQDKEKTLEHAKNAVLYAKQAVLLDNSNINYQLTLAVYLRNLSNDLDSSNIEFNQDSLRENCCNIIQKITEQSGVGDAGIIDQSQCIIDRSYVLTRNKKYDEAIDTLHSAISHLNLFAHLNPTNKSYNLKKASIYIRLTDIHFFDKRHDSDGLNCLDSSVQNWVYAVKGKPINPSDAWVVKNIYENIERHTNSLPKKVDQLKIYKAIATALDSSRSVYSQVPSIAYILAKNYENIATVLLNSKTRKDSVEAETYMTLFISTFEKAQPIEDDSVFNEGYATFCKAFDDKISLDIASRDFVSAQKDYDRMINIFSPIFKKFPFDFYLGQHFWGSSMRYGKFLYDNAKYKEAIPVLEIASYAGMKQSTNNLIDILENKFKDVDTIYLARLKKRVKSQRDGMKKFTIPCEFGTSKAPFDVYVIDRDEEYPYKGIDDQAEWLWQARGGKIPEQTQESFRKLQEIAWKNQVSYGELCVYALQLANNRELDSLKKEIDQTTNVYEKLKLYETLMSTSENHYEDNVTNQEFKQKMANNYVDYANLLMGIGQKDSAIEKYRRALKADSTNIKALEAFTSAKIDASNNKLPNLSKSSKSELYTYIFLYLKKGNRHLANLLSDSLILLDTTLKNKENIYKIYQSFNIDKFKELFLLDTSNLLTYRNSFKEAAAAKETNKDKISIYKLILRIDEQLLKYKQINKEPADDYNTICWYYLLEKEFSNAELAFKKGIQINPQNIYLLGNNPHILLLTGKTEKAKLLYLKLKDLEFDKTNNFPTFKDAFLDDFKSFETAGIHHPDFDTIRQLLNQ